MKKNCIFIWKSFDQFNILINWYTQTVLFTEDNLKPLDPIAVHAAPNNIGQDSTYPVAIGSKSPFG